MTNVDPAEIFPNLAKFQRIGPEVAVGVNDEAVLPIFGNPVVGQFAPDMHFMFKAAEPGAHFSDVLFDSANTSKIKSRALPNSHMCLILS